jgi:hypothetical protein
MRMATSSLVTVQTLKSHLRPYATRADLKRESKKYVTKRVFRNFSQKTDRRFKSIDENFKSVDRALRSLQIQIVDLRTEFYDFRKEMRDQFALLISEIRQDRLETLELRNRLHVIEVKVG